MAKKKGKRAKRSPRGKQRDELPPLPDRRWLEQVMWGAVGMGPEEDSPEGRAQEVLREAYETEDTEEQVRLAHEALKIWPDSADAYVLLAEHASSLEEAIKRYEEGVAAGQRALGEEAFKELEGDFWGVLETRPYMRARLGLAQSLWNAGRREEAIAHYQDLLRLNPGDNQGVRYLLVTSLLDLGRHEALQRLLDQFGEDGSAVWSYTRALLAFQQEGDTPRSRQLLKKAAKTNKHVPQYLVGNKSMPRSLPSYLTPGGEDEAVYYTAEALSAWRNTPGAVSWAREVLRLGLPQPEERPEPSWSQVKRSLLRLPEAEGETWEIDARPFPAAEGQSPPAPWVVAAVHATEPMVLALEPEDRKPSAAAAWEVLVDAMRKPREGEPRRPERIDVRQRSFWTSWKKRLEEIGVECRLQDHLEGLDSLFEGLTAQAGRMANAGARPETTVEELEELPQSLEESWQMGVRRLPIWIGEKERPFRPWGAMVVDGGQGFLLANDLSQEEPTAEWLWGVLAAAMTAPAIGDPRRPGRIELSSAGTADALRPKLEVAGVEVEVSERLEAVDSAFDHTIKHLTGGEQETALVDVPGMRPEQVAGFYEAAAGFYRRTPWRRVPGDSIIQVESPRFQSGPWYAVVMGQSGMTVGLALYDDLQTLRAIIEARASDEENFRRTSAISVTFGEEFDIPAADLEMIEKHHWPIAGPEAYPHVVRVNPGFAVRPPLAWELELLEACLRAIPEMLEQNLPGESVKVRTASGQIDLNLTRLG